MIGDPLCPADLLFGIQIAFWLLRCELYYYGFTKTSFFYSSHPHKTFLYINCLG